MKAFFSKVWNGIKFVCSTAWNWCVGHKVIAIVVASVLAVGTTCAIVLPIALHEHSYAAEWSTDADNHWHDATCKHEEEKSDLTAHTYTNACDTACDVCGYTRTVGAHVYDNACDNKCNVCSAERTVEPHVYDNACDNKCNVCSAERTVEPHVYDNACDNKCNVCSAERTVEPHVYDNACDNKCNVCGATRTITHDHADTLTAGETTHYYACSVCGDKKDEEAHVFDKTVASSEYLKAAATATTKAQYYKSCVCGAKSATEYFETDKTAGTLANIQDLSKTYDKVELANPTYETNSDGAVTIEWYQGDTKLDAKPVNAGTYKVKVIIAESTTYTGISAEKEFTIAKKVLSNMKASIAYDGSTTFGEMTLAHDGIVSGDVIIADIDVTNKNVGVYTGTDAMFTILDVLGHGAANYEIDAQTTEVTVTPKTLNYLEITKVYDGKRGFGENAGIYCPLGVEHGVIAGDTVFLETSDDLEYNVGKYYFVRMNSTDDRDTVWLFGDDAANYDFQGNDVVGEVTVTKRPVWAENVKFTYDGNDIFCGDEYPIFTLQNVVSGETIALGDVSWCFDSKNVGATLTAVELSEEYNPNYTIDFSKCSASIIPRVIDNLTYAFEYNGMEYHQAVISKNEHSGIVGDDQISLEVCFATPDVGAALDTSEETGFEPSFVEENYVLGTNYEFSIIPREIWVTGAQFYYDGYTTMMDDVVVNGITIHNAASTEDEYYMGGFFVFRFEDSDVGSNLVNVTLELEGFSDNYTINVSDCEAEIIPMELTNLNVQITEDIFETGSAYLNATNGVVHGDKVYITWTESGHNSTAMWKERGSDLVAPREGMPIQGEAQVTLEGADASNYTLVTTNNKYGTMTYSEKCKPDVFGYCACGNNHTTSTYKSTDTIASVPVGPAGGTTWEGGIYALNTTTPGYWSIKPNDNYCTVTVYNPYGYRVTMKGFEFYAATAGTYYVHISKNSEPAIGDVITFRFAYSLEDNGGSYDSLKVNAVSGSYYYFKINADAKWGASLCVMDGNGNVLDSAKYTVKIFDQDFDEMTDVVYDGTDIYKESDDDFTLDGKVIYIQITLNVDTELYISAF